MEWLSCIKKSIEYIETNIKNDLDIEDIANNCYISSYYLQFGFKTITGINIGEYIRNRRLYLAALDIINNSNIVDVAFDYGYTTQESFTKAFKRFHGVTPSKINRSNINIYKPIQIEITIKGGNTVDLKYKIVDMFPIKIIGFVREFNMETSYEEIPKFWDEICEKYCYPRIYKGLDAENEYEQAIVDNCIGEYAVCVDGCGPVFKYILGGHYTGGNIPKGMEVYEFKRGKWAVFDAYGPCPKSLQDLNTKIFKEWLPLNAEYELREDASVEWYDCQGDMESDDYHTQIWLPVRKIEK